MHKTNIEYIDYSWNPIAMRCTSVSEGCTNCWHIKMADRMKNNPVLPTGRRDSYSGGPPVLIENELQAPLKRKKPAIIGVQFMGDLYHENVSERHIGRIYGHMAMAYWHTFLILTKRPNRMAEFHHALAHYPKGKEYNRPKKGPPPNVIIGVSAENQQRWDERIPILLQIPAAKRFVSIEPMLGPIDISHYLSYNPIQEDEKDEKHKIHGRNGLFTCPFWRSGNRCTRKSLENQKKRLGSMATEGNKSSLQESESRTRSRGISNGQGNDRRDKISCPSKSISISPFLRPSPDRANNKSQRWKEKTECPKQFRDCNIFRASQALSQSSKEGANRSMGRKECYGKTNRFSGRRDTDKKKNGGKIDQNSQGLQCDFSDNLKNSPQFIQDGISWCVAGCESGPNRRQAKIQWFRDLKNQCVDAGIPFFLKQANGYINGKSTVIKMPYLDGQQWAERCHER